jgi:hypothetical protein
MTASLPRTASIGISAAWRRPETQSWCRSESLARPRGDRQCLGETAQQRDVGEALNAAFVTGYLRSRVSAALPEFSQGEACGQACGADNGARVRAGPLAGHGPFGSPGLFWSRLLRTGVPVRP